MSMEAMFIDVSEAPKAKPQANKPQDTSEADGLITAAITNIGKVGKLAHTEPVTGEVSHTTARAIKVRLFNSMVRYNEDTGNTQKYKITSWDRDGFVYFKVEQADVAGMTKRNVNAKADDGVQADEAEAPTPVARRPQPVTA